MSIVDLKIKEVRVFLRDHGTDEIEIRTVLPSPIIGDALVETATFSSHVTRDRGIQWVRKNLGVEPTVFNPFSRTVVAPAHAPLCIGGERGPCNCGAEPVVTRRGPEERLAALEAKLAAVRKYAQDRSMKALEKLASE